MENTTLATLLTTTTVIDREEEDDSRESWEDEEDEELSDPGDVLNYGVPIAIMIAIIVALCTIVVYTKIRKRRQRAAGQRRDTAPNISGGVAMSKFSIFKCRSPSVI